LSVKLLLLTIFFVLLSEVFIYVPSIINFRKTWLEQRVATANIAILAIRAAPDHIISQRLSRHLLDSARVVAISLQQKGRKPLVLNNNQLLDPASHLAARYDLRSRSYWAQIRDTVEILFYLHPRGSLIQVTGEVNSAGDGAVIRVIFPEDLLRADMKRFSVNVMLLSIIISLITAGLVYFSLSCLLIRPVQKMTRSVMSFRNAPEMTTADLATGGRGDEIGIVMRELASMQDEVRKALIQKKHLAQLGESVSKINHDLRNILSSAQMVSDYLSNVDNPVVQKLTPRFVTAVDRAIRLCENTLKYGKAEVEKPVLTTVDLAGVIDEVALSLGIPELNDVRCHKNIPENFTIEADADQIFRVFLNLCRNALQAMKKDGEITISAYRKGERNIIEITDNGPGIPARIKATLFQPFHGSADGGSGLGLAISRELVEAHGGSLDLVTSDDRGTCFRITLV